MSARPADSGMMARMGKWLCPCGSEMRDSGDIPNPQEWHLIADADLDIVASAASLADHASIAEFNKRTRLVYRCAQCERLHVFWDDGAWPPAVYTREPAARSE